MTLNHALGLLDPCETIDLTTTTTTRPGNCRSSDYSVQSIARSHLSGASYLTLSHLCVGNVRGFELVQAGKPSQFVSIVFVGFTFHVFEQPGILWVLQTIVGMFSS